MRHRATGATPAGAGLSFRRCSAPVRDRWRRSFMASVTVLAFLGVVLFAAVIGRLVHDQIADQAFDRAAETAEILARGGFAPPVPAGRAERLAPGRPPSARPPAHRGAPPRAAARRARLGRRWLDPLRPRPRRHRPPARPARSVADALRAARPRAPWTARRCGPPRRSSGGRAAPRRARSS